jgi:gamma-glutamyltranspeptidase / glutathione hydrolase
MQLTTGIGGDMFLLYYNAETKIVSALNGSGRAPASLSIAGLREKGIKGNNIPMNNINSVTVPGAAAGWIQTLETFGNKKLSVEEILTPAIKLAEDGYPVSELASVAWHVQEKLLKTASPNGHEMLRNGRAPKTGEIFRNPTLAETFRTLAREGQKGFYEGRIAKAIVDLITTLGGELTLEDLKSHKVDLVEPITINYQGLDIWECPPNGQGIVALMALGILDELQKSKKIPPLNEYKHNSAEYLHVIIEALRLAFADAMYHIGDPATSAQTEHLLSKSYLAERAKSFNPHKQLPKIHRGEPIASSDTVYFSVTDQWGNAASFINSNFGGFGTGAVPESCGFTLQNRGGGFVLREGEPNSLKGGRRPYHTIIPAMVNHLMINVDCRSLKEGICGLVTV